MASELDAAIKALTDNKITPGVGAVVIDKAGKELYNKAFGKNNANDDSSPNFTTKTEVLIWSQTKLVVAICALQLLEQGLLSLDDPVSKYLPDVGAIPIITGWDDDGKPVTRPRTKEMRIIHLMTHTSGISYDFFEQDRLMYEYRIKNGQPAGAMLPISAEWQFKDIFLLFEPGERHHYGQSMDILGLIIDKISGMTLEDYVVQNVARPIGMHNTGAVFSVEGNERMIVHLKDDSGALAAVEAIKPADPPQWKYGGGHFLVSSLHDYTQLLLTLLNEGTHPGTGNSILKPETVRNHVFRDLIPDIGCSRRGLGHFTETINKPPNMGNAGDVIEHLNMPDEQRGWSCGGLLINSVDTEGCRKAGSGGWSGLGNLYFWLDPTAGKAGILGTSVFPFLDPDVLKVFEKVERFAYSA